MQFSFNKICLKMSSATWQPFCLRLNMLSKAGFQKFRQVSTQLEMVSSESGQRSPTTWDIGRNHCVWYQWHILTGWTEYQYSQVTDSTNRIITGTVDRAAFEISFKADHFSSGDQETPSCVPWPLHWCQMSIMATCLTTEWALQQRKHYGWMDGRTDRQRHTV